MGDSTDARKVFSARLEAVRVRIENAGGNLDEIAIVAVTKGFEAKEIREAIAEGIVDIGENYEQELRRKASLISEDHIDAFSPGHNQGIREPRWHFLGHIQRRKIPSLAPVVSCWQGVSRIEEAEEIARRAPGAEILIEVKTTPNPSRNGVFLSEVTEFYAALSTLDLVTKGLMTVAPRDPDSAKQAFSRVKRHSEALGLSLCSMGMSEDFEAAVSQGSTMVRLGEVLFGKRPLRTPFPKPSS